MTGAEGLGSAASLYFAQQAQAASPLQALQSFSGGEGAGGVTGGEGAGQNSASISGLGQLFSNLQQLQAQDPSQFTQVVSQVAGALQSAAQQQAGSLSQFLTNLATSFQQAASTGTLPQLHPHGSTESQSYNSAGQPGLSGTASSTATTFQQLFTTLANQVGASLGG